jgi:hypothetical protein
LTDGEVVDRLEIFDLLVRYAECIDTGTIDALASEVFAPGIDLDLGAGRTGGRAAAVQAISASIARFSGSIHAISNQRVTLEGELASSTCVVQGYHWLPATEAVEPRFRPADVVLVGMYVDAHRRTPAGWRIERRRFRRLGASTVGVGALPDFMLPRP